MSNYLSIISTQYSIFFWVDKVHIKYDRYDNCLYLCAQACTHTPASVAHFYGALLGTGAGAPAISLDFNGPAKIRPKGILVK